MIYFVKINAPLVGGRGAGDYAGMFHVTTVALLLCPERKLRLRGWARLERIRTKNPQNRRPNLDDAMFSGTTLHLIDFFRESSVQRALQL
jgi:hypothetical protein